MPADTASRPDLTEFHAIEPLVQRLTGADYDSADAFAHPATLLAKVVTKDTIVYGWWPASFDTPCMAWKSPRGWAATVVDTTSEVDPEGWGDSLWFTRVRVPSLRHHQPR